MNADACTSFGMPLIGYGTYMITNEETPALVETALRLGYRHIDTAESYKNETGVAEGIRRSGLPRESIFITSKIFPGREEWGRPEKDFAATVAMGKQIVANLQSSYVDLLLIHAPLAATRIQQWKVMLFLQEKGLVKHIGVSNYGIQHLKEIEAAGLAMPVVNQLEIHPLCQQKPLLAYMKTKNIFAAAFSSLAPLGNWRNGMEKGCDAHEAVVEGLAKKHKVSQAQILLRWALQKGYSILPKSTHAERMRSNRQLFHFALEASDVLDNLDTKQAFAWGGPATEYFDPTVLQEPLADTEPKTKL